MIPRLLISLASTAALLSIPVAIACSNGVSRAPLSSLSSGKNQPRRRGGSPQRSVGRPHGKGIPVVAGKRNPATRPLWPVAAVVAAVREKADRGLAVRRQSRPHADSPIRCYNADAWTETD